MLVQLWTMRRLERRRWNAGRSSCVPDSLRGAVQREEFGGQCSGERELVSAVGEGGDNQRRSLGCWKFLGARWRTNWYRRV